MKICMLLEGCYPYVRGGVSAWTHNYIHAFHGDEFVLWTVCTDRASAGKFKYELPENVSAVHEVFLSDAYGIDKNGSHIKSVRAGRKFRSSAEVEAALLRLFKCENPDWERLFAFFGRRRMRSADFLKSEFFFDLTAALCCGLFPHSPFADVYYSVSSMALPLVHMLTQRPPEADIYHAIATGYCGVLGALGSYRYKKPLIVSEHGIYTREREEEILRAKWAIPYLKDLWIAHYYMLSRCAYDAAVHVTCLFEHAREIQIKLNCPPEKTSVIANGIIFSRFSEIAPKKADGFIDIGAVVRIAPIKDIKTMIYAFSELKYSVPNARLHILGDTDDAAYGAECRQLVSYLKTEDVFFTGNTNVEKYFEKLDFTILTSISEGQPLAVLESMAAARPVVSTDVGSCRELIETGPGDGNTMPGGVHVTPSREVEYRTRCPGASSPCGWFDHMA